MTREAAEDGAAAEDEPEKVNALRGSWSPSPAVLSRHGRQPVAGDNGAMPAEIIGDVGLLRQALLLADASTGHTHQAKSIRARLLVLGSNPPGPPPPREVEGALSGYL